MAVPPGHKHVLESSNWCASARRATWLFGGAVVPSGPPACPGLESDPHDRSRPACCLCPRFRERHVHRPQGRDPLGRLLEHQLEPGLLQALRHLRRDLPEEHPRPAQRRDHRGAELHPLRPLRALLPGPRDRDAPGGGRRPRGEGRQSEPMADAEADPGQRGGLPRSPGGGSQLLRRLPDQSRRPRSSTSRPAGRRSTRSSASSRRRTRSPAPTRSSAPAWPARRRSPPPAAPASASCRRRSATPRRWACPASSSTCSASGPRPACRPCPARATSCRSLREHRRLHAARLLPERGGGGVPGDRRRPSTPPRSRSPRSSSCPTRSWPTSTRWSTSTRRRPRSPVAPREARAAGAPRGRSSALLRRRADVRARAECRRARHRRCRRVPAPVLRRQAPSPRGGAALRALRARLERRRQDAPDRLRDRHRGSPRRCATSTPSSARSASIRC